MFSKPTIAEVERRVRALELRADELDRQGKHIKAEVERSKAEKYRRRALPKAT